jgi:hypothetical protein
MPVFSQNRTRFVLGTLLAFVALNALAGGYYGVSGADGVPREWLQGSPFNDYLIPGLFLMTVIGGSFTFAALAVFARLRHARPAAFSAVMLLLAWLAVQVAIIGYVSWMQPATATAGILALFLACRLQEPSGEERQNHSHGAP